MTRGIARLIALAMISAGTGAYADVSALAGATHLHNHLFAHLQGTRARSSAGVGVQSDLHRIYEREGLTRNPDDCAVWGCIGNN